MSNYVHDYFFLHLQALLEAYNGTQSFDLQSILRCITVFSSHCWWLRPTQNIALLSKYCLNWRTLIVSGSTAEFVSISTFFFFATKVANQLSEQLVYNQNETSVRTRTKTDCKSSGVVICSSTPVGFVVFFGFRFIFCDVEFKHTDDLNFSYQT